MGNGRETRPQHLPEVRSAAIAVMSAHPIMVSTHLCRPSLDLLRMHHERIEAWVLKQAGVEFGAVGSLHVAHMPSGLHN